MWKIAYPSRRTLNNYFSQICLNSARAPPNPRMSPSVENSAGAYVASPIAMPLTTAGLASSTATLNASTAGTTAEPMANAFDPFELYTQHMPLFVAIAIENVADALDSGSAFRATLCALSCGCRASCATRRASTWPPSRSPTWGCSSYTPCSICTYASKSGYRHITASATSTTGTSTAYSTSRRCSSSPSPPARVNSAIELILDQLFITAPLRKLTLRALSTVQY